MRRLIFRLAALTIIGVLASLPILARLHDRLTASDQPAGFRLSKNLERPREKHSADAVAEVFPILTAPNLAPIAEIVERPLLPPVTVTSAPAPVRAPPIA